ncbi:hypothetical protein [Algicola sagamiensis]|uniref:hypothetical protein n=1 Tax=Algicola sagamiensis TaxID=163869 RepID=UPI0012F958DC|nr:hypothetical protein [Algicola sagamiensis]
MSITIHSCLQYRKEGAFELRMDGKGISIRSYKFAEKIFIPWSAVSEIELKYGDSELGHFIVFKLNQPLYNLLNIKKKSEFLYFYYYITPKIRKKYARISVSHITGSPFEDAQQFHQQFINDEHVSKAIANQNGSISN